MTTAGHNSSTLSAAEARALHFHHFNAIQAQKDVVKSASDVLKKLRKTAKADGVVMADIDYMARCAALEDPEIVPAELARRAEIASWFALPVNYQVDMFTDRAPIEDRAFEEGKSKAQRNGDPVPPYDAASAAGQAWMNGWHEGQRIMRDDLQAAMEKKNTQKTKPSTTTNYDDGNPMEAAA